MERDLAEHVLDSSAGRMKQPYGKIPRGGKAKATPPLASLIVKIHGRHTIEQLSLEIQKTIALMERHGVYGAEEFRFQLKPFDEKAQPMALWNEKGEPVPRLKAISGVAAEAAPVLPLRAFVR